MASDCLPHQVLGHFDGGEALPDRARMDVQVREGDTRGRCLGHCLAGGAGQAVAHPGARRESDDDQMIRQ